MVVELIGNALFLPLTQTYAPHDVRVGHVLSRVRQIPRLLNQVRPYLTDADPVWVSTAVEENAGNIDLIENTLAQEIPAGSPLKAQYDEVAPPAIAALNDFSRWLQNDLAKRPSKLTWRLGKELYDQKFKLVMETPVTPEQVLADAEQDMKSVRAEMLQIALPLHAQMYPGHNDHAELRVHDRENLIIGEVLQKISDEHPRRDQLQQTIEADLAGITQFIREKKIVSLSARDNLKVIPTPPFERGIYSVAGFHSAPPLEPQAEAEYWVTPIDPKMPEEKAESKLREYNNFTLQWLSIHEALPGTLRSVRTSQQHSAGAAAAAAFALRQRRLRRGLGRVHRAGDDGRRFLEQRSAVPHGDAQDSPARDFQRDSRHQDAHDGNDRPAGAGPDDQGIVSDAGGGGRKIAAREAEFDAATNVLRRDSRMVRAAQEISDGCRKNFNLLKFHDLALDEGPLPVPVVEKLVMPTAKP